MKECMKDARKKHAIIFEMNPYNKTAPPTYKIGGAVYLFSNVYFFRKYH